MSQPKLTIKQERFCQKYIECGNASEAYRFAYNAENMSQDTIKVKACNLLKKDNIAVTIESMQSVSAERHAVTVDSLCEELNEAIQMARELKQPTAITQAVLGKARLHGLDKRVIDNTSSDGSMSPKGNIEISEMTDEQLLKILKS